MGAPHQFASRFVAENMKQQLTEEAALTLLKTHCDELRARLVFDARDCGGADATQLRMALRFVDVDDSDIAYGLGFEVRLAVDVINALCSCDGYEPHRNPRFWRQAVSQLWIDYTGDESRRCDWIDKFSPPPEFLLPFDRAAFSYFSISVVDPFRTASGNEATMIALWRQLTWTDAEVECPPYLDRRDAVMNQLAPYMIKPVRTVQLNLILPTNKSIGGMNNRPPAVLVQQGWQAIEDALRELGEATRHHDSRPRISQHQLSVTFGNAYDALFYLHVDNLGAIQRLLTCCPFLSCHILEAKLEKSEQVELQVERFGSFLWSLLVEKKMLRKMSISAPDSSSIVDAAICSLLPISDSLEILQLTEAVTQTDQARQMCWLVYALTHPRRKEALANGCPPLALRLNGCRFDESATFDQACSSKMPLQNVVREIVGMCYPGRDIHEGMYKWYSTCSAMVHTVDVSGFYLDPQLTRRLNLSTTPPHEVEVVAEMPSIGAVGVVVPGYGVCWVDMKSVDIKHKATADTSARLGLSAVELCNGTWDTVVPLIKRLDCCMLKSLTLGWVKRPTGLYVDRLSVVLRHCPNLTSLHLESCVVYSTQPLVDAYESSARLCRISSLSLRLSAVAERWMSFDEVTSDILPLLDMLCEPNHRGTRVLRHLNLILEGPHKPEYMMRFATMLASNTTLENAFLHMNRSREEHLAWTASLLTPFQDQLLCDARATAIGLVSVVHHCGGVNGFSSGRCSSAGRLDLALIQHILGFIGPSSIRCVRWLCEFENCFPSLTFHP